MFSVIVPLYNKESFVAETLTSVLEQTFSDFELLIINDGSTDNSVEVVKTFTDQRIKLFTIANSGVSVARNLGIEKATNQWIAFLDADDWWATNFLSEMKNAIDLSPKQMIFASGRSRVFKNKIDRYQNKYLPVDNAMNLISYFEVISVDLPPVNSSNSVFNAQLFSEIGIFKPNVSQHEDHDLWIRLCAQNPVVFLNKELSYYRKTELNTASSQLYKAKHFLDYIHSMNQVLPQLSEKNKTSFLCYTNRFIPFSFLKHSSNYLPSERKQILSNVEQLLSPAKMMLLKVGSALSFLHLYKTYKSISK